MSHLGIFESIDDPMFVMNAIGDIVETNHAFSTVLGSNTHLQPVTDIWPEIADIWESSLAAADSGKQLGNDVRAHSLDGREFVYDLRTFAFVQAAASERLVAGIARDVTAERKNASLLEIQATTDVLTSAYNRRQLEVLLTQAIRSARRRKKVGSFILIDVDNFKWINDNFGHDQGDRVLKQISEVLHKTLRDSDVVGRLGGDEFGVILTDSNEEFGSLKALQIAKALNRPVKKTGTEGIEVSIGLSIFPLHSEHAEDIIKHTDTAMYRTKKQQGSSVEVWES